MSPYRLSVPSSTSSHWILIRTGLQLCIGVETDPALLLKQEEAGCCFADTHTFSQQPLDLVYGSKVSLETFSHIPAKLQMARIYEKVEPEERSTQLDFNALRYSLNLFLLLYLYKREFGSKRRILHY